MAWNAISFGISNACGDVWLNGVGKNKENDEEHDANCVEDRFQLARVKFDMVKEAGKL